MTFMGGSFRLGGVRNHRKIMQHGSLSEHREIVSEDVVRRT